MYDGEKSVFGHMNKNYFGTICTHVKSPEDFDPLKEAIPKFAQE